MTAFADVTARRQWFVPDVVVWGLPGLGDIDYLAVETVDGNASVFFNTADVGAAQQEIAFGQLIDDRGNNLPTTLNTPRVLVRPRSETPVFIVGRETDQSFRVARDPAAAGPVTVDLLIIEAGA